MTQRILIKITHELERHLIEEELDWLAEQLPLSTTPKATYEDSVAAARRMRDHHITAAWTTYAHSLHAARATYTHSLDAALVTYFHSLDAAQITAILQSLPPVPKRPDREEER